MLLTLTVRQRLVLENFVKQEKSEDNDVLELLIDLKKKIGFTKDERDQYISDIPGIGPQIKDAVIDRGPVSIIDFEMAELRKIEAILKTKTYTADDAEMWYYDLRDNIKAAKATKA